MTHFTIFLLQNFEIYKNINVGILSGCAHAYSNVLKKEKVAAASAMFYNGSRQHSYSRVWRSSQSMARPSWLALLCVCNKRRRRSSSSESLFLCVILRLHGGAGVGSAWEEFWVCFGDDSEAIMQSSDYGTGRGTDGLMDWSLCAHLCLHPFFLPPPTSLSLCSAS